MLKQASLLLCAAAKATSYWLMGANNILTTQRIDPIVNPGTVGTHVHAVLGGSNFALNLTTTSQLRSSQCTSIPILEDKSNYWFPLLYFQRNDGSFTSVDGSAVIYYLFTDTANYTTAFPDDFRMISGDPTLRSLDPSSFAQQAITYICLDFTPGSQSSKYNELPKGGKTCPDGIRSQINFPSCWDGKNTDSPNHKSHISFPSTGPDNGTCNDPDFPITVPRVFIEVYWNTAAFENQRSDAMDPSQPFVFSNGDPTGYGYHADFFNGWDSGVLQRAIQQCNCNPYGDPTCCVANGAFTMQSNVKCLVTDTFQEDVLGNLSSLPGANPVQQSCYEEYVDPIIPPIISPVFAYTSTAGSSVTVPTGSVVTSAQTLGNVPTAPAGGKCIDQVGSGAPQRRLDLRYFLAVIFISYMLC